jgi:hypothetical protein
MTPEDRRIGSNWLSAYAADRNSQCGEDGIIEKILDVIEVSNGWCVEFGAWDGIHLSNTYDLIQNKSFSAVLIEGSKSRYADLVSNFADNPRVIPMHEFVGFDADTGLDSILARSDIPEDFDVLSIDIDGNDYHVWKAVSRYKPKVVVIEFNPSIPSNIDFAQVADMSVNQGSSALAHKNLGSQKSYELVCMTDFNCIFVRAEYYEMFDIDDNSIEALRPDDSLVTYLFSGFDGTVFIRGHGKLPWHGLPILERSLQQVPRWLRQFPSNFGPLKKFLSRPYLSWRKRRS